MRSPVYGIRANNEPKVILHGPSFYHGARLDIGSKLTIPLTDYASVFADFGVELIAQHYYGNYFLDLSAYGKINLGLIVSL